MAEIPSLSDTTLLIRDFGLSITEHTIRQLLCRYGGVHPGTITVGTVSEPSRFEMFKQCQVHLKGYDVRTRHLNIWKCIKGVADLLTASGNRVWVGGNPDGYVYVPLLSYPVKSFSIGSYIHPGEFIAYYINTERRGNARVRLEFDSKRVVLYFFGSSLWLHQLDLNMKTDLSQEIVVEMEENRFSIYLLYNLVPRVGKGVGLKLGRNTIKPCFENIEDSNYEFNFDRVSSSGLFKNSVLGGSNCLKVTFNNHEYESILDGFQSAGFTIYFTSVTSTKAEPVYDSELLTKHGNCIASFSDLWAFQVILSRGMHVCQQLKRISNLEDKFKRLQDKNSLEGCLYQLSDILESGKPIDLSKAINYFLDTDNIRTEEEIQGCCYIRRILVTPTRHMYFPPQCMVKNRILRDYDPESAVTVSFKDDDMQTLSFIRSRDFIREVVKTPLEQGFRLGNKHYEFLAASNSQLRAHGVWFYAEDDQGWSSQLIRDNMGDLRGIRCVASYVARMGQCFTATEDSFEVAMDASTDVRINQPDIEVGEYVFSDGIGRISPSLAQEVAKKTGRKSVPSMFQIRYGGCKGTVAVDPDLVGDALHIRKSMCKFESDHQRLEIARVSDACPLFLNHSAIMLMHDLGVPTEVFQDLQNKMIQELAGMFYDNDQAADYLAKRTQVAIGFRKLAESGFSIISDSFFREMLFAVMESKMRGIRDKAKIELPSTHARNMLGAMDETSTLQYGQVFIQYTNNIQTKRGPATILDGDVIVTKFPALHQGDIRRFQAVDITRLHHMKDCIVFPSQGKRPHPNEMAGSDLDGDDYFVTWLPVLLDTFPKRNKEPMDFPPAVKTVLRRDVKLSDITEFIFDYICNDRLGQIANAHKVHADKESIFSPICQQLAKKHSEAVDFAKTGHCPELTKDERVQTYPDFMGKHGKNNVRHSSKALGQLFRESRKIVNIIPKDDEALIAGSLFELNKNLTQKVDERRMPNAIEDLKRYRNRIQEMMNRFGIESEAEMLSGCIRRLRLRLSQRDEKFEVIQVVNKQMKALTKTYRENFFHEFGGEEQLGLGKPSIEMLNKAVTWYTAAYTSSEKIGRSLPWVVWDLLSLCCGVYDIGAVNPVFQAISESMPSSGKPRDLTSSLPAEGSDVLHCIEIWAHREGLSEYTCQGLYLTFSREQQSFGDRGTALVNFFKWAALQKRYPKIQLACQKSFFSLVCSADFDGLMGRHSEQYREFELLVPCLVWVNFKRQLNSHAEILRDKYDSDVTIKIRRNKRGKYPDGKIFCRAKNNDCDEIESSFITFCSQF